MNQVGSLKANMGCLELVFLHNILIRRRQFSSPKAEVWGRKRGNLCSHAGVQGSREWAWSCFSSWGKSKVTTVEQTGMKGKCGSERGEPRRSCQTTWKQERHGCNFWRMASQSLSPQIPDTRSWDRGIWVGLGWILPMETLSMTTQKADNTSSGKGSA